MLRWTVLLVAVLPALAFGQAPPRLDAYGDPLPEGALLRIGTARLRPGATVASMAFTPDGKKLVTATCTSGVHVWDVATGKELHALANPGPRASHMAVSPDGARVVTLAAGGPWIVRDIAT